ncbi:MAG TPA: hypothetical protein PK530_12760 [Anaerolineales bacterium]|nr:hypothetical protein [Anaerolineales bacterium]
MQTPLLLEQFHANAVQVTAGRVQKIWPRGGHILVVLGLETTESSPEPALEEVESPGDESRWLLPQLVLRLDARSPTPLSLFEGDRLDVTGWLDNQTYAESVRDFLTRGQHTEILELIPSERLAAQVSRTVTHVVPEKLTPSPNGDTPHAQVVVEGLVARTWTFNRHRFARLAVYDQHTEIKEKAQGKRKFPQRTPHYITVQFTDGKLGAREVVLKPNTRVRVTGPLISRIHSETFRDFLLRAHATDVLTDAPNSDKLAELRARYVQTYLVATTMIQFTN